MAVKTKPPVAVTRPHPTTVYARTGKGVLSFKNGTAKVSNELKSLFTAIDGKASVTELRAMTGLDTAELEQALESLDEKGYIKIFKEGAEPAVPDFTEAPPAADAPDLDVTSPGCLLEIRVREQAEAEE